MSSAHAIHSLQYKIEELSKKFIEKTNIPQSIHPENKLIGSTTLQRENNSNMKEQGHESSK